MTLSTVPDDLANTLFQSKMNLDRLSGTLDEWTRSGQGYPDFPFFRADRGEFVYPPWDTAGFRRTSTQVITSGAWATLVPDKTDWNTGIVDYSTASTGIFRFTRPSDMRVFLVFGHVAWRFQGTSAGPKGVKLVSYPSTQEFVMSQLHGSAVAQSFSAFYRVPSGTTGFSIQVYSQEIPQIGDASVNVWELGRQ